MSTASGALQLPSFDLSDRVAIVTGGSRGIGRQIARTYAAAGANIVIASRKAEACETVAAELVAAGASAKAIPTHMGDSDAIEHLVDATVKQFGGIDIVVNNAANPLGGALDQLTDQAFHKAYDVNVLGPLRLATTALPHLKASKHACVINVISVGAFNGAQFLGLYTSAKAAVANLTKSMAKEWGPLGIRVNALAPGPFDTDMMAATLEVPAFHSQIVDATIVKRVATTDEIAGPALLLASDAGSYLHGSLLVVDGGTSA